MSKTSLALLAYARTKPPAPSLIPPKYLTTTIKTFSNPNCLIISKIGIPAVPAGSPSSLLFCLSFKTYA